MTDRELRAKFDENAEGVLDQAARDRVAGAVENLETLSDTRALTDLIVTRP